MKKILVVSILLLFCVSAQAAQDRFIDALRNCSAYSESGNIDINGTKAYTIKQMTGWHNDKCMYKETINLEGMNISTNCNFTRAQIKEITSVADAYYLTQQYSPEAQDFSSVEGVKNNPVARVLSKYLQDPSVCTMSGL